MTAAWVSKDYLADGYVAPGWLRKQNVTLIQGAWLNKRYTSKKWVSSQWFRFPPDSAGAAVSVQNVPNLALHILSGSAKQIVKVNATEMALPLRMLNATVHDHGHAVTQVNVPHLSLAMLNATVNGYVKQVANVTFTVSIASTIHYARNVTQANVPNLALNMVDAAVSLGQDVNVAADRMSLPLSMKATSVKANAQTNAVATIHLPLVMHSAQVAVGLNVRVQNVMNLALTPIDVYVTGVEPGGKHIFAHTMSLPLAMFDATVSAAIPGGLGIIANPGGYWGRKKKKRELETELQTYQAEKTERQQKRKEIEAETAKIADEVDREIARLIRQSEAKAQRNEELEKLKTIASKIDAEQAREEYGDRAAVALERAVSKGNYSALEALERELERSEQETQFLLEAARQILIDD